MSAEPLRVLDGGGAPRGWGKLWAKDVWPQSELPQGAKRWARARLLGDTTPSTMRRYLTDLWHFSDWLAAHAPEAVAPALLTREVLEDYLLWVRQGSGWMPATRNHRVVALRALLEEQAEDRRCVACAA